MFLFFINLKCLRRIQQYSIFFAQTFVCSGNLKQVNKLKFLLFLSTKHFLKYLTGFA